MTARKVELEAGELLGRYRVGHRIDDGPLGERYEALDTEGERAVVAELLRPEVCADRTERDRLLEVARVQQQVDSAHVLRVLDVDRTEDRAWVITETVAGGPVAAVLDVNGPPPLPIAVDCAVQVSEGLAAGHAAGLVHGDLTAQRVLLEQRDDESLRIVVTGFGSLRTDGRAEAAHDVRAAGALLWTLVSGDPAYDGRLAPGENAPQLLPESAMAVEVNRVLRRSLAPDAVDAPPYRDAAELRADLDSAAAAPWEPVADQSPDPAGPAPAAPDPTDEDARQVLIAALVAVVLVVGTLVVLGLLG